MMAEAIPAPFWALVDRLSDDLQTSATLTAKIVAACAQRGDITDEEHAEVVKHLSDAMFALAHLKHAMGML